MPLFYEKPSATDTSLKHHVEISESFLEPTNAHECLFRHRLPVLRDVDPLLAHLLQSHQSARSNDSRSADIRSTVHSILKQNKIDEIVFKKDNHLIANLHNELKAQLCDSATEPNPNFMANWVAQLLAHERTHDGCVFPCEEDQRSAYRCSMLALASQFLDEESNLSASGVEARNRLRPTFALAPKMGSCTSDFACYLKAVGRLLGFIMEIKRCDVATDELKTFMGDLSVDWEEEISATFDGSVLNFPEDISETVALMLTQVSNMNFMRDLDVARTLCS